MQDKLRSKDFINLGIFSVLFLVVFFICIMVMSFSPFTQPFGAALAALFVGPIYMLMRSKVNKFGGILISGVLFAIVMFATGGGWPITIAVLVGTILAELVSYIKNYKNFLFNTLGYAIYMTTTAIGSYAPLLMMKDYYLNLSASNSINGDFMIQLMEFISGPVLVVAFVATIICSILGSFLARAMFKKHFIKAGIIKEVV